MIEKQYRIVESDLNTHMNEPREYYSPDEVAAMLNLHVRTIRRFIHDGKLKAARVGKQYRITESDLKTLASSNQIQEHPESQNHRRQIAVSTTVDIDDIGQADQQRLANVLSAAFHSLDDGQNSRRLNLIYSNEKRHLRLLINADLDITNAVLGMIRVVLDNVANN